MKHLRTRLGARLRELRLERRLTQEQLAERAGLSYKFIGEVERGLANPTVDTLTRLSDALEVDVVDLFGQAERRKPRGTAYVITPADLQVVREAFQSLGDVLGHVEPGRPGRQVRRSSS